MKSAQNFCTILLIVSTTFLNACKTPQSFPRGEQCLLGTGGCVCFDETKPKGNQDYILPFEKCVNYWAVSPEFKQKIEDWGARKCKQ